MVNANVLHPTYLLKAILSTILARGEKSAIVVTSSTSALFPMAGMALYCASKVYDDYLA